MQPTYVNPEIDSPPPPTVGSQEMSTKNMTPTFMGEAMQF
eukprot:CAMPEP_0180181092 /NCGR_PEP_ID=MMETSP0986-20121125/39943_1 /TAXON_ID=697907 /ORGANISM="non described non described, Strain CCMP2293" /LENGTH=39 /DNA_ID= /DNA_START= /DNA_END= /DNA_ORIENTATION=